ncbi:TonB-dependent receptor [Danxiaibacter flavus]|uniref:TonB-dependent receptor n=1 Tax=Danxiaibacter flavus TaxID=3049108 RepID=A0ABV3ZMQ2_9BACT|nr:TonB-dependent receptor [Chitinophagaceae bacterium DXS]
MKKIALSVTALMTTLTLWAQKDSATNALDEVVVTATKSPKKLSETGKVLTVISHEQLERSAGKDIAQVLNEQTGIVVNGATSNPGKDKSIYMRGAKSDYTLILIDGIPLYDPSGLSSNFDIRTIPIENIERVEILKGSQSTLYGADAIAGVINIITKRKGNKEVGAFATASYGSFNTFKGNAGVNGSTKTLDYNVAYTYYDTKGISEAKDPNGTGTFDKDGYKQHGVLANLGFKVNDHWKITPFLRYNTYNGKLDAGAYTDDRDYTYKSKSLQTGVRSELTFGKSRFTLNYSYNTIKRDYLNDSGYVPPYSDQYYSGGYKGTDQFAEIVYSTELAKGLQLVSGVDYRTSNTSQSNTYIGSWGQDVSKISKDSAMQHQFNAYASLLYTGKVFHAEAGARYNNNSIYGTKWTYNFNPFVFLNKEVKIFANISSAFKTPTLYQLYAPMYGNSSLKAESAVTYEGGVQYFQPEQKFNIRGVIYKRDVNNVIAFTNRYVNQDEQHNWGVEIEPTINFTENLQLVLQYAHTKGKLNTQLNGKDSSSSTLLRVPEDTYSMALNYRASKKLFLSMNIQTFGARKDLDFSTYPSTLVNLEAYTLWSAYGEYKFNKHVKVFADFKNITNTDYVEVLGYSTQPASVQAGLTVTF